MKRNTLIVLFLSGVATLAYGAQANQNQGSSQMVIIDENGNLKAVEKKKPDADMSASTEPATPVKTPGNVIPVLPSPKGSVAPQAAQNLPGTTPATSVLPRPNQTSLPATGQKMPINPVQTLPNQTQTKNQILPNQANLPNQTPVPNQTTSPQQGALPGTNKTPQQITPSPTAPSALPGQSNVTNPSATSGTAKTTPSTAGGEAQFAIPQPVVASPNQENISIPIPKEPLNSVKGQANVDATVGATTNTTTATSTTTSSSTPSTTTPTTTTPSTTIPNTTTPSTTTPSAILPETKTPSTTTPSTQ